MYGSAASVLHLAGLPGDVDDAVQDAMISIMKTPPTGPVNWEALLVAAAKRKGIDRVRSAHHRHSGGPLDEEPYDQPDSVDVAEEAITAAERPEVIARVRAAFDRLDERHQHVLIERLINARPRNSVAADLDVSPGRISQIVDEGLQALRDTLQREEVIT
jgi:RNA polymerase sigma-70 factor (ECF subfamily)